MTEFLRVEPGVEAIRFNPTERVLSIATLGQVDRSRLEEHLQVVIAAAEKRQAARSSPSSPGHPDIGITLARHGEDTELTKPTCPTAPRLWHWREFAWPEQDSAGFFGEEWRFLATLSAICATAGLLGFIFSFLDSIPYPVSIGLYLIALTAGAWDAAIDTAAKIRQKKIDIHFLMLAVAVGASLIGAYGEAVLLLFLFSAAGAMEAFAEERTRKEIKGLFHLQPRQALRVCPNTGAEQWVEVKNLRPGERIRVRPGDLFPVDGTILEGETEVDEATLTGESLPVRKGLQSEVYAGTVNLSGSVLAEVTKPATESALEKILNLIRNAQNFRAPSQRFTDKFGVGYTVGVLTLVTGMFFLWWLGFDRPPLLTGPEGEVSAFYLAMTLLVVASPCALVISIPSAILAAIAYGARRGILFRGGAAIENFAEIDTICLDKTGTLTTGEFTVTGIESFPLGREDDVLRVAASLEKHSRHPLAQAIIGQAQLKQIPPQSVENAQAWHGVGMRGVLEGQDCLLGRRHIFTDSSLDSSIKRVPPPPSGISEVWVLWGSLMGRILLRDTLRPESKNVIRDFQTAGIVPVMLTGDHPETAQSYGRELGLTEIFAGLLPEDKVARIQALTREGRRVAMVGDGVNDAPSLAAAQVSVGMGARGSDAALEQCDFVLMRDHLPHLLTAWRLSRKARAIIRQNLFIALGTVVVVGSLAMGAAVPLSIGVLAHEGSTVIVCLNSLRLLRGP